MNHEDNQLDGYIYDIEQTKKSSNYNVTDKYIKDLMTDYIDEWCCNFNLHSPNILNIIGPGYIQHKNIALNDGEQIFNTRRIAASLLM